MANQYSVMIQEIKTRTKTKVINKVHELTGCGLKKARELVESKGIIADAISKKKANNIRKQLEAAGAIIEIRPTGITEVKRDVPIKDISFKELNTHIAKQLIPESAITRLRRKKVKTLADIRRNGGMPSVKDLDAKVARDVEAYAYLSLVSDDPKLTQKLIKAGFDNTASIAGVARNAFIGDAKKKGVKEEEASLIHAKAKAIAAYLTNVITGLRAEQANGYELEPFSNIEDLFPTQCECRDCESVVSPLAYLVDLLDYITTHVKENNHDLDLDFLEAHFHQPFGRLTSSCEEVDRKVRQVRICIEVLRGYLKAHPPSELDLNALLDKEKAYLLEAYKSLLEEIGTSYDEIRLAKTADREVRRALAERLGFELSESDNDELEQLLLSPEQINEQILERLFGLVDTTRNPLCDGIQSNDTDEQIKQWNFSGVQWNTNTDRDGNIYGDIRLTNIPPDNGLVYMVSLYKDVNRTRKVASGTGTLGTFLLSEVNDSGLSARIHIEQEPAHNRFEISVIPRLLAWRLEHLRTLWKKQDWPVLYPTNRPVIDPDVIHIDCDFRRPYTANSPRSEVELVWERRRQWVDRTYSRLLRLIRGQGFDIALQEVYGEPIPDLDTLADKLQSGEDVEATMMVILLDLDMTIESFTRFVEIRSRSLESPDEVDLSEWEEAAAILTQVEKVRKFADWIHEESQKNILIGPHDFWVAIKEPDLTSWLASQEMRAQWQYTLQAQSRPPSIDPDLISPEDLRSLAWLDPAYTLLREREQAVSQKLEEFRGYASDLQGFESLLADSVGADWPIFQKLLRQREDGEGIERDLERLALTMDSFEHLILLHRKLESGGIHASEWEEFHSILLQTWKTRCFAIWRKEEKHKNITLSQDFFAVAEKEPEKLPPWRTTWMDRWDWQDRLQSRIDQESNCIAAMAEAVDSCEESTLSLLRDALILVAIEAGNDIEIKADFLAEFLLVDFKVATCQKTTRPGQAIVALQNLVFSIKTGQLDHLSDPALPYPISLTLDDDNFDEAWKWLGSYATWKAAVGVFLYPENILLPSLRRQKTGSFSELIGKLRGNRRLTPKEAQRLAKKYSNYFNDVCNLTIQATCTADITLAEDEPKILFYMFGLSSTTKKVYWSYLAPSLILKQTEIFWEVLPVSDLEDVIEIVGASPFFISDRQRFIFLFLLKKKIKSTELVFIKYDLDKQVWIGDPQPLEIPLAASDFNALVKQTEQPENPPHIAIRLPDGTIYDRRLNEDGSDWAAGDWKPLIAESKGKEFDEMRGFFEVDSYGNYGLILESEGSLLYRYFGTYDDGYFTKIDDGAYLGAFPYTMGDQGWYVVFRQAIPSYRKLVFSLRTDPYPIDGIADLNDWLISVCGLSLRDYSIYAAWHHNDEWKHFFNLYDLLTEPLPDDDPAKYSLLSLQLRKSQAFIENVKESDYTDELYGNWKWAADSIREFTPLAYTLEDLFWLLIHGHSVNFRKRRDDQISNRHSIQEAVISITPSWGFRSGITQFGVEYLIFAYEVQYDGDSQDNYCCIHAQQEFPSGLLGRRIGPVIKKSLDASGWINEDEVQQGIRYTLCKIAFTENIDLENSLEYIKEVFYFVPMALAIKLQGCGQYTTALEWYRTVYNYTRRQEDRKIYYGLEVEEDYENCLSRPGDWLLDPLDIHKFASIRRNTYTRFTLLSLIGCMLDFADSEFSRDSAESLVKATRLYETTLELLDLDVLNQPLDWCENAIERLKKELKDHDLNSTFLILLRDMTALRNTKIFENTLKQIHKIMRGTKKLSTRVTRVKNAVAGALAGQTPLTIKEIISNRRMNSAAISRELLQNKAVEKGTERSLILVGKAVRTEGFIKTKDKSSQPPTYTMNYLPSISTSSDFCIPFNPMISALRLHTENNLHKLRTCRNIAGVKREVEPYAAPIDVLSAMPAIGAGGQVVLPTMITPPPVPYRYEFLIERAKQLSNMSAQMESAFLSAIEKRDAELYAQLRARQDVRLARAGVRLQNLRLRQAQDEVKLAELQRESAQIQAERYQDWLVAGLNQWELRMINAYHRSAMARTMAAFFDAGTQVFQAGISAAGNIAAAPAAFMVSLMAMGRYMASSIAIQAETSAQVAAVWAGYERRAEEWQLQRDLALQSMRIGDQQIKIANDGVNIVQQERDIAQIQVDHAEAIVEFLDTKFTNVELFDWMSSILENVYSFFLQHAAAFAKLAQNQLAFERQEPPPAFIQDDYWEVPGEGLLGGIAEDAVDRHGLTGSARLLADIYKLDQYRLETSKRKLQMTKIISLARFVPYEFQRFKETGNIVFASPMELFDRDFPGHYLRLITRVRTSVVALIPPTQGIKATLSSIGISKIVVNKNALFQTITAHRPPESVALTSPSNATGLFELQIQPEMLFPYEGLGVDTVWEFRMPKAANLFDFETIADVLISIEYTALNSYDYRQQVIETLRSKISADRPFSFKQQFADQWYDLHNPGQSSSPMSVPFRTRREDFPPNIERLKIEHVLLYFVRASGISDEIDTTLLFRPDEEIIDIGGQATSVEGIISTRRGNAGSWTLMIGQSPIGEWQLVLPNTEEIKTRFENEEIEDILFVITYSGRTPQWPE